MARAAGPPVRGPDRTETTRVPCRLDFADRAGSRQRPQDLRPRPAPGPPAPAAQLKSVSGRAVPCPAEVRHVTTMDRTSSCRRPDKRRCLPGCGCRRTPGDRHFADQAVTSPTTPPISVFIHDETINGERTTVNNRPHDGRSGLTPGTPGRFGDVRVDHRCRAPRSCHDATARLLGVLGGGRGFQPEQFDGRLTHLDLAYLAADRHRK